MDIRAWWRRRGRVGWQRLRWWVLGLVALLAILLGYLGFREHFRVVGEARSPLDALYLALQLFTLESGSVAPPIPWALGIARWLAPLVAVSAAIAAAAAVLSDEVASFRLRRMRDHVVICGLDRKGSLLAEGCRRLGWPVVAIERDEGASAIRACREDGAIVLVGDATDDEVLRRARVPEARILFAVCGEDGTNADLVARARLLARTRDQRPPLTVVAHVVDVELCRVLRSFELATAGRRARVDYFSVYESAAAAMLRGFPPGGRGHLVIVGCGQMGRSLVQQAARAWRLDHPTGERLRVTIVDRIATRKAALLIEEYRGLDRVCDLRPLDLEIRTAEFATAPFLFDADGRPDVDIVYVCVNDGALGLWAGAALLGRVRGQGTSIVVRASDRSSIEGAVTADDRHGPGYEDLHVFPVLERTCTPEMVLAGPREILARAIHEDYVRNRGSEGVTPETDPSTLPWDELHENLRESNRAQADHIGVKLEAIGCILEPTEAWDEEPLDLSDAEVEILARLEHERWMSDLERQGWRFAPPPKDPDAKTSPYLVPWEELPDPIKEYDREAVRGMPRFLALAGFRARRITNAPRE